MEWRKQATCFFCLCLSWIGKQYNGSKEPAWSLLIWHFLEQKTNQTAGRLQWWGTSVTGAGTFRLGGVDNKQASLPHCSCFYSLEWKQLVRLIARGSLIRAVTEVWRREARDTMGSLLIDTVHPWTQGPEYVCVDTSGLNRVVWWSQTSRGDSLVYSIQYSTANLN